MRFVRPTHRCAELAVGDGDRARAIRLYERALELEPGVESLHRELCALLVASGRRDLAREAYRRCRHELRRHHGMSPSFEL